MWINATLEHLAGFYRKHSLLFKDDSRNLSQDAMIKSAELYAIILEMKDREAYGFLDEALFEHFLPRIRWLFRQLLIEYRINYKEFSQFEEDNSRFFKIDPTGKVKVNPIIYNIPRYYSDKGMYPDLGSGVWVKEYMIKEEEK